MADNRKYARKAAIPPPPKPLVKRSISKSDSSEIMKLDLLHPTVDSSGNPVEYVLESKLESPPPPTDDNPRNARKAAIPPPPKPLLKRSIPKSDSSEIIKLEPLHPTVDSSGNTVESKLDGPPPLAYHRPPIQQNLPATGRNLGPTPAVGFAMPAGGATAWATSPIPTVGTDARVFRGQVMQPPFILEDGNKMAEPVPKGPSVFEVTQKEVDNFKPSPDAQGDFDYDNQHSNCCSRLQTAKTSKICHTLQQVLCCISIILCLWPLSCICLCIALKTSNKVRSKSC